MEYDNYRLTTLVDVCDILLRIRAHYPASPQIRITIPAERDDFQFILTAVFHTRMSKEKPPIIGAVTRRWHRFSEGIVSGRYDIRIADRALERIADLRDFLSRPDEEKRSVILYFNHQAYNDPILAWRVATLIDPDRSLTYFAPSSAWSSKIRVKNAKYLGIMMASKLAGVHTIPVVQAYQVNNPDYGYTEGDARESYERLLDTAKSLRENGPVFCMISPEGTRSQTIVLQDDVYAGILKLGRTFAPTVYVPLAITFPEGYERDSLNLGRQVSLDMGEWSCQSGRFDGPTIRQLMDNLADALPPMQRGPWGSPENLPEYAE